MQNTKILNEIIQRITANINPEKIILFGSYARDEANIDSDIDLLVIKSGVTQRRKATQELYRNLHGIKASVDIILETPERLEKYKDMPGMIYKSALKQGQIIYGK